MHHIYPEYFDTLIQYYACPKLWTSPFYYPWVQNLLDAMICSAWSESTLTDQDFLSKHLG